MRLLPQRPSDKPSAATSSCRHSASPLVCTASPKRDLRPTCATQGLLSSAETPVPQPAAHPQLEAARPYLSPESPGSQDGVPGVCCQERRDHRGLILKPQTTEVPIQSARAILGDGKDTASSRFCFFPPRSIYQHWHFPTLAGAVLDTATQVGLLHRRIDELERRCVSENQGGAGCPLFTRLPFPHT